MSDQTSAPLAPMTVRAHVWIQGRVQGVGYRISTYETATQLQLAGWVRNLQDGRVEAVFEGEQSQVKAMIQWCHSGPPAAHVTEVQVEYEPPHGLEEFQVTR
jgi:acylphosphatase